MNNGYVLAMGACMFCKQSFAFNPHRVPSYRVNGKKEPICRSCMAMINRKRQVKGLEPFQIDPAAYDAIPEGEL